MYFEYFDRLLLLFFSCLYFLRSCGHFQGSAKKIRFYLGSFSSMGPDVLYGTSLKVIRSLNED